MKKVLLIIAAVVFGSTLLSGQNSSKVASDQQTNTSIQAISTNTPSPLPTNSSIIANPTNTPTPHLTITNSPTPTYIPSGASAICRDGTYSFSEHRKGTCSHHGGVEEWL